MNYSNILKKASYIYTLRGVLHEKPAVRMRYTSTNTMFEVLCVKHIVIYIYITKNIMLARGRIYVYKEDGAIIIQPSECIFEQKRIHFSNIIFLHTYDVIFRIDTDTHTHTCTQKTHKNRTIMHNYALSM